MIGDIHASKAVSMLVLAPLHQMFAAVKRGEHDALAVTVTDLEWQLYGTTL